MMMSERTKETLTQERLKELLKYDSETGMFYWLVSTSNRVKAGEPAGSISNGYRIIMVDKRAYRAHRLAWLYAFGSFPVNQIDHIDRDRLNNRICNLRQATNQQNSQNVSRPRSNNKSGYLGVRKQGDKWVASIYMHGKKTHLGTHATPEAAHLAYVSAKKTHHSFARAA
jgi:hypothetical protein